MSYNSDYNAGGWIDKLLEKLDRAKCEVTFDPHAFDRSEYWSLDIDKVEETVRTGSIVPGKCKEPNKLCFERYFGKENTTYAVIARFHEQFIEVKTVWPKNGR